MEFGILRLQRNGYVERLNMERMAGDKWKSNKKLRQDSNMCTHSDDRVTTVTLWELPAAFFINGISLGLHMGGNITIFISPPFERSLFCLLQQRLLNGNLCGFTDDTRHINITYHFHYISNCILWWFECLWLSTDTWIALM